MQITVKNFDAAIRELNRLGDVPKTREFREMLRKSVEVIQRQAQANVHSRSGRTVASLQTGEGRNTASPSAYLKINKKVAFRMWKGKPFPYPYALEHGHRRAPAYPFFRPAVESKRAEVRRMINDGVKELFAIRFSPANVGGEFL